MTPAERLWLKINERMTQLGTNARQVSLSAGLSPDAVRTIKQGKMPGAERLSKIAAALNVTTSELIGADELEREATGIEYAGESYASVAVYEAAVSAGPGSLNAEHAAPLAYNLFRRDWLRSVTRVPVEHLAILKVHGDSMAPTLMSGDDVLVDMSIKHIGRDGLYVLAADHEVQVKRVSRSPLDKSLSISSDNPAAQSWVGVSDENVFVLGRVIWLGRTI
jgi:phage repressor protein C with HTH and peptisase S24 domain